MQLKILLLLFLLIGSIFSYGQIISIEKLVGKWQKVAQANMDSSVVQKLDSTNQEFYEFFKKGSFKFTHKRNDKQIKQSFLTVGRWKIANGKDLVLYQRRPDPQRPNTSYGDLKYSIVSMNLSELILHGNFSVDSEGGLGKALFKKL